MKKMNMVEKFGAIKAMLNGEKPEGFSVADALKFLDDRIEKVNAKNAKGADRKPTKVQVENEGIKEQIIAVLQSIPEPTTVSGLQKISEEMAQYNNQKISALLTQLVAAKRVVRTEVKGKAHFAIAE